MAGIFFSETVWSSFENIKYPNKTIWNDDNSQTFDYGKVSMWLKNNAKWSCRHFKIKFWKFSKIIEINIFN
jgi:hypothetical protein